jgi:hypothetical protein
MNFKYYSSNIIGCENFLPSLALQDIRIELSNNRGNFNTPVWNNSKKEESHHFFSSHCGGFDYWIHHGEQKLNNQKIINLHEWFYSQGLFTFIKQKKNVFNFLEKSRKHNIHVVAYNHDGYYNWHKDSEMFTFNLILNQGNDLLGGDMLFMDDGKIITIPNQDNFMVVFPSYIDHAITQIKSKNGKDVPFPQQRFSIQYWVML